MDRVSYIHTYAESLIKINSPSCSHNKNSNIVIIEVEFVFGEMVVLILFIVYSNVRTVLYCIVCGSVIVI